MTSTVDIQDQIAALEAQKRSAAEAERQRLAEQTRNAAIIADADRQIAQLQAAQRLVSLDAAIPVLAERAERINARNAELIEASSAATAEVEDIYNDAGLSAGDWKDTNQLRESFVQSFIDGYDQRTVFDGPPERRNEAEHRQLLKEIGQADAKLPLAPMIQHVFIKWVKDAPTDLQQRLRRAHCAALGIHVPSQIDADYDPLVETRKAIAERRRHGGF